MKKEYFIAQFIRPVKWRDEIHVVLRPAQKKQLRTLIDESHEKGGLLVVRCFEGDGNPQNLRNYNLWRGYGLDGHWGEFSESDLKHEVFIWPQ
jgi:hypothetical protein